MWDRRWRKKVLQWKTVKGWDRLREEDIRLLVRVVNAPIYRRPLKEIVDYLFCEGKLFGIEMRFDKQGKCREESYKSFSETERYYRIIEEEAGVT